MKSIKDIEKLEQDQLYCIAEDESVSVPSGLSAKLNSTLISAAAINEVDKPKKVDARIWMPSLAVALASVAILLTVWISQPKDSFTDPMLAYAEVEKTFELISAKLSGGETAAIEAVESINDILNIRIK